MLLDVRAALLGGPCSFLAALSRSNRLMIRRSLSLVGLAVVLSFAASGLLRADDEKPKDVKVRWFGHACFELKFPTGLSVVCDPYDAAKFSGYVIPKDTSPDVVTVSHEHFDHATDKAVPGSPEVLRGLTGADAKTHDWKKHDLVKKGVRIRSVGVFHDAKSGAERGKNTIFVFEPEKKGAFGAIAHLGDLGHVLTDEQAKEVGPIAALLLPVGGKFTIDADEAKKVVEQLKPRVLIFPMHYKTDGWEKSPLATAEPFLKLFEGRVKKVESNETTIPPDAEGEPKVVVLEWKHGETKQKENGMKGDQGSSGLSIGATRAWVNAQPGLKDQELHLTADLTASGGAKGGTLTVEAKLDGKKLELEDDATSEAQPAGGWKLDAGKKRAFKLVLKEGQKGAAGGSIQLTAMLVAADGGSSQSSTSITVQDVH
jgi:L-ascorbate metabolism protein UlaG (beta-lactamase superfamily)